MSKSGLKRYEESHFFQSKYCDQLAYTLNTKVHNKMQKWNKAGTSGKIGAHLASPFVGLGTCLASICLRIGSIIEPIIGIFADFGASIYYRSSNPLKNIASRFKQAGIHLPKNILYILRDTLFVGVASGIGGIFSPKAHKSLLFFR